MPEISRFLDYIDVFASRDIREVIGIESSERFQETDFVLEEHEKLLPVEVKASSAPTGGDARQSALTRHHCGAVVGSDLTSRKRAARQMDPKADAHAPRARPEAPNGPTAKPKRKPRAVALGIAPPGLEPGLS